MNFNAETKLELVKNRAEKSQSDTDSGTTGTEDFASVARHQSLRESVAVAVSNYFDQLDGQDVTDVYEMVLSEIEAPLLEQTMAYTRNNQTRTSQVLGLNRGTLRKKLKKYGLL